MAYEPASVDGYTPSGNEGGYKPTTQTTSSGGMSSGAGMAMNVGQSVGIGTIGQQSNVTIPPVSQQAQPQPQQKDQLSLSGDGTTISQNADGTYSAKKSTQPSTATVTTQPAKTSISMPEPKAPVIKTSQPQPKAEVQQPKLETQTQTETKPKDSVATAEPQQQDFYAETMKALQSYLKTGQDLLKQEFSKSLDGLFSTNSASIQAARLRLNQAGMSGADGSSLLELIARDTGMKTNEIVASMKTDQIQKMLDLDRYGFEGLQSLAKMKAEDDRSRLSFLLENGQYEAAGELWSKLYPGSKLDSASLRVNDPKTIEQISTLMSAASDYEASGNLEQARLTRAMAARLNPQLYGTNDPEEAYKRAMDMDYSAQQQQIDNEKFSIFRQSIDAAVTRGDMSKAEEAAKSYLGAKALDTGLKLRDSMSFQEVNQMLTSLGKDPLEDPLDVFATDPEQLAIDHEVYNSILNFRKTATAFQVLEFSGIPRDQLIEMSKDKKSWDVIEAWVKKSLISPAKLDPNSPIGVDLNGLSQQDISDTVGHYFTDWPMAEFNTLPDGSKLVSNYTYDGYNAYDDSNPRNDPGDQYTQYQMRLDSAWEDYVSSGRPGGLDRKTWFEVSGAGQLSPKQVGNISDGIANQSFDEPGPKPTTTPTPPTPSADYKSKTIGPERASMYFDTISNSLDSSASGNVESIKNLISTGKSQYTEMNSFGGKNKNGYNKLVQKYPGFIAEIESGGLSGSIPGAFKAEKTGNVLNGNHPGTFGGQNLKLTPVGPVGESIMLLGDLLSSGLTTSQAEAIIANLVPSGQYMAMLNLLYSGDQNKIDERMGY